jgi:hypothetical protein
MHEHDDGRIDSVELHVVLAADGEDDHARAGIAERRAKRRSSSRVAAQRSRCSEKKVKGGVQVLAFRDRRKANALGGPYTVAARHTGEPKRPAARLLDSKSRNDWA